jgi:Skp family chaperone for outer membrane proteins
MAEQKEPMIGRENRPTAIDYDAPIRDFKLRDLYAVIHSQLHAEQLKVEKEFSKVEKEIHKVEKEHFKGEKEKEHFKGEKEKEIHKVEKEFLKGEKEKEFIKPEKEILKGEKEFSKPEKPIDSSVIDQIADAVVQRLRAQGLSK